MCSRRHRNCWRPSTRTKLLPSSNAVPERFEYGTLPYEMLAGASAAVDFLAAMDPGPQPARRDKLTHSLSSLHDHEQALRARLEEGLRTLGDTVTLHSKTADRTPTLPLIKGSVDSRKSVSIVSIVAKGSIHVTPFHPDGAGQRE